MMVMFIKHSYSISEEKQKQIEQNFLLMFTKLDELGEINEDNRPGHCVVLNHLVLGPVHTDAGRCVHSPLGLGVLGGGKSADIFSLDVGVDGEEQAEISIFAQFRHFNQKLFVRREQSFVF